MTTNSTPEDATEPPKQTMEDEVNSKKRPLPDDGEGDADKLAARREANRIHALKSRQRSKALLQELQRTVTQLSGEKSELERENAVMRAQIEVLQQQNIALTQSQRMLLMRAGHMGVAPGAAGMNGMSAFASGLFGLSHAASMPTNAAPGPSGSNNTAATTAPAPMNASTPGQNPQTPGTSNNSESMDQAAVAAAAAAMIQGQAAAAAAAAGGYQPHFSQKFMQEAFAGAMAAGTPTATGGPTPANTPAAHLPAANASQTPAPTPNATPVGAPAPTQATTTTAPTQEGALGQGTSQQSIAQGDHPLLA